MKINYSEIWDFRKLTIVKFSSLGILEIDYSQI